MKTIILSSLIALSTVSAAFAQTASPTPTPSVEDQITQLKQQVELAKLKAELAATQNPTPAPTPTPAAPPVVFNNNIVEKNNSDNVTQQAVVNPAPTPAPTVIVVQPTPAPELAPNQLPSTNDYLNWTFKVYEALSKHNWEYITNFTVSGHTNYFGHRLCSNGYIADDMQNDALRYVRYHNQYDLNSFRHDVSDEYSPHWVGPMVYDSITVSSEVWEANGTYHHANVRFTVGYTFVNNATTIYALVMKVL